MVWCCSGDFFLLLVPSLSYPPHHSDMSSNSSSLASRSDAVSLKSEPSTDLAPVTGLTADEQFANENCLLGLATPTECMARKAPDTPLVPISQACCQTFVTCLHLYLTPLMVTLAHRPCLASPLAARVLSALRHDILRTTRENTTPSRLSVPKRLLPPLQEFPAKMPAIRALDRLDTTTST